MERGSTTPVLSLADAMISGLHEKNNNFTVVKHYNTFGITAQDAALIKEAHPDLVVYYHQFTGSDMVPALEPFMTVIKDMYQQFYSEMTAEAYINKFEVYPLHQSVFVSMLENGMCRRTEELLLDEVSYEQEQMLKSVGSILLHLSKEHPFMLVINNLNLAAYSAIRLLTGLFGRENSGLLLFAAFNDLHPVPPYMASVWETYTGKLEDHNCMLDGGVAGDGAEEGEGNLTSEGGSFYFESSRIFEYLLKLNNMYCLLDFEQAKYYLAILYQKIEMEKLSLSADSVFDFFRLYAQVSLYSDDISGALHLCDNLQALRKEGDFEKNFYYDYILGMTQMYNGRLRVARDCALSCKRLAEEEGNARCMFQANLLELMVRMSGWHNIFFCKSNTPVPDTFIEQAGKYHYENHLAYTYIFAYDNDVALFEGQDGIDKRLVFFEKGIALAKEMKNEYLLMAAYRKNIMLSSAHGLFDVTNYYYYKSMEIVGDTDPFKLADIYNGLGYISCAVEQYERANGYYNRAIEIFYRLGMMNHVGETLYNMAMNCMLAGDHETAYVYLQNCMKIVNTLHLNDLRVCNISKIFGLLALCAYKLNLFFNCRVYLDNSLQFLSHVLNREKSGEKGGSLDLSYTACDDDIFLYYYVEALLKMDAGDLEKALFYMQTAQVYVERSIGNQFFSKVQFALSFAKLYRLMGREDEAQEILKQGLDYAKKCGAMEKYQMLQIALAGQEKEIHHAELRLEGLTLEEIQTTTRQAGVSKNYAALKNQMEFLGIWQNTLEITGRTREELIRTALNTFVANFSIDVMLYIRYHDGVPEVCYDTKPEPLTEEQLAVITDHFSQYHAGFVTSKMRKNHVECNRIVSLFGTTQVCSMICLPYYVNERLDSIFIMYINMKDNWNSPITKYMLDESEYNLFNLMLRQLLDAVAMLENEEEIRRINSELEKSAITDYLTGLYNRNGFYSKIHSMLQRAQRTGTTVNLSFLYIDLDNFKYYNDTFGHDVGDMIIREVGRILKDAATDRGFATRFGGDEFLVTLLISDREEVLAAGRGILNAIRSRNAFAEQIEQMTGSRVEIPKEKRVSCSVGIAQALHAVTEDEITAAIQKADEVLYSIKHSEKGDVRII